MEHSNSKPVLMAKPVFEINFSGEGEIDLVLFQDELLLEVTAYIHREDFSESLSVSGILLHSTTTLEGEDVNVNFLGIKENVLDLIDKEGIYSIYLSKLEDLMGTYEPVNF